MALVVKDRVRESSATTGTGSITLSGAYVGFQTFASAIADSSTVFYCIHNTSPGVETEWEVGYGTYSANTLTRDTIYSSSTGSAIDFSAGTKEVFVTYPSESAVYEDNDGNVTVEGKITVGAAPTADLDVATKLYVDNLVASGIHFHTPVRLEHVGNLPGTYDNGTAGVGATLTNNSTQVALTADGVAVDNGDRILFYEQTDATQNGVYVVTDKGSASTNWVLTRATDADSFGLTSPNTLGEGSTFFVREGNTASGETYTCNTVGTITFGTTNITFAQVSAAAVYSGVTPIDVTGTAISLTTVPVALGGTNISSYTVGEVLYASGTTTLAQLAGNTTTTAKYLTQTGTGSASAAPTWTALAASATTDTTDASNISSGTLPSARISGSYTGLTGTGTLTAGTWNADVISAAYGGTGLSSYTIGDIVYATGTTTIGKLADIATGNALLSGGIGALPSYGKVGLTTHVSGVLPVANGGTGQSTASGAINALVPSQTGNSGEYLTTDGSVVSWAAVPSPNNGTLTMAVSGTGLSGSASFTADQAGASSFTVTSNATNANTASAVVARDGSGNFSAGTITAALTGNASTATALATARTIGGVSFDGTASINLPGVNSAGNQDTSGNAATATTATTATNQSGGTVSATNAAYTGTLTGGTGVVNIGSGQVYKDASGNVGIGTSSPTFKLSVIAGSTQLSAGTSAQAGLRVGYDSGVASITGINHDNDTFNPISFFTGASASASLDTSGNFTATGNVTAYSDERLKKDWEEVKPNFVDQLANVKSGTYTRTDSDARQAGVSAQSLQELLPETVMAGKDGMLSVAYGNAAMVAVVELAKEVRKLKEELRALKGE